MTAALLTWGTTSQAQNFQTDDDDVGTLQLNTITTAVPFLMIAPDSRSGALGDIGVSLSPDANSMHWNLSKIAFAEKKLDLSLSYTPWLRQLVPDINLAYLSGYFKVDDDQGFGASLRYFSLGDITFTDAAGNVIGSAKPNEFAVDMGYARKLTDNWSAALAGRFVFSNLTQGYAVEGANSKAGLSGAADVSAFYRKDIKMGEKDAQFAFGINISNIGSKMSYTASAERDFIPTNLRLGPGMTIKLDEYNKLNFGVDFNKLLVPTPPIYERDSLGNPIFSSTTNSFLIASGKDPEVGVATGIFQSFSDAPGIIATDETGQWLYNADGTVQVESGSRFKEEMREINVGVGVEYFYGEDEQLALRAGYFHESATKGNRKYFTLGAGLHYTKFTLDFAYLIPTQQRNPLANTLRFTLRFSFDELGSDEEEG